MAENNTNQEVKNNKPRKGRKQSPRGKKKNANPKETGEQKGNSQQKQQRPRNNKNHRNRRPWRKHVPEGTVDPITLEELTDLRYPPFALHAAAPYLPVTEWPPKAESKQKDAKPEVDPKQREQALLLEQWGHVVVAEEEEEPKQPAEPRVDNCTHFNLFDGKALAIYMVSQQQFIDPLNRRDLSREELVALDQYLRKHGVKDIDVLEAYDTKGVSLSAAGAASTTAAGRAQILQEEAQVLLNALFTSPITQQYQRHQQTQEQEPRNRAATESNQNGWGNTGVYGDDDEGMMVIDDDRNPSMRGDNAVAPPETTQVEAPEIFPALTTEGEATSTAARPVHMWSGHHITSHRATANTAQNFPALAPAANKPKKTQGARSAKLSRERRLLEDQWGTRAAVSRRPVQSVKPAARPAKAWGKTHVLSVR